MHIHRMHPKAPDNFRNSPDFLQYMRWERKQYNFKEEHNAVFLSKEEVARQLAPYYRAINDFRRSLREADREPDAKKRQGKYDALYMQIDAAQEQISIIRRCEVPGGMMPNAKATEALEATSKPTMKVLPATMPGFPPLVEERIETRIVPMLPVQKANVLTGTDAYAV